MSLPRSGLSCSIKVNLNRRPNPEGKILELIEILETNKVFGDNEKASQVFAEFKVLASYVR